MLDKDIFNVHDRDSIRPPAFVVEKLEMKRRNYEN